MSAAPLSRTSCGAPAAPVRMLHLGLGAFHRAHQAWYTWASDMDNEWGISGYTGRRPDAADVLARQDSLYTLIERGPQADRFDLITSLSEARSGADLGAFAGQMAASSTALVTLTISEAAYRSDRQGGADRSDEELWQDAASLADIVRSEQSRFLAGVEDCTLATVPARLVLGLEARRRSGAGPLALVSCDNVSANGTVLRQVLTDVAREVDSGLAEWINSGAVSFVETSIDRITPATQPGDAAAVASATGWHDSSPVVTEPFSDWILSGEFPGGRPQWERAGARFVDGIQPFEQRKLWLLNGAHSLLAYAGIARGLRTVGEAIADDVLRRQVEAFWDEAMSHLDPALPDLLGYRRQLLARFGNSRIEHRLSQIAADGSTKLGLRIAPVARAERAAGRDAAASAFVLGSWIATLRSGGAAADPRTDAIDAALRLPRAAGDRALVRLIDHDLADDSSFVSTVGEHARHLAHDLTH
jgi:fructuronate reductase